MSQSRKKLDVVAVVVEEGGLALCLHCGQVLCGSSVGRGSCRALLFSLTVRAFAFEALVVHSHIHIDRSGHVQRR